MSRMPLAARVDRNQATVDADTQRRIYEALDALALAIGPEATEVVMAMTGTVVVSHGSVTQPAHDPDLQTGARKVVIRWLRDQGM